MTADRRLSTLLFRTVAMSVYCALLGGCAHSANKAPATEAVAVENNDSATVLDFGAVGDGKADDTAAVQRAVDGETGSIVFPRGSYRLTKTIEIHLDKVGFTSLIGDGTARIIMAGAGPAFHFTGTHGGTADPLSVKPQVWESERTPIVDHLEIVGENAEADGIEASGTMQLTVTNTVIRQARHAIHLTTRNRNIVISNCHLYNNRGIGVFYDHVNLHQSNIVGCHISYNAGGGIVTRGGEVRNIQIGTCDIESNMAPNTPASANVLLDNTGGSTDEVAIVGCTLQHNSKSAGSANIRVIGRGVTSTTNPTETEEGHIAIVGNAMSDVKVNIHLDHARGVTITGNTFWEGFEHDLLIENSQCIVVGPNDFDRNPRYVINGHWKQDLNGLTFRNCSDCKLSGLIVKSVWTKPAAVHMEKCNRCTITDVSILDSDGIGLLMKDCTRCKVADCVIRDDRTEKKATLSLKAEGGTENWIRGNVLADGVEVGKNQDYLTEIRSDLFDVGFNHDPGRYLLLCIPPGVTIAYGRRLDRLPEYAMISKSANRVADNTDPAVNERIRLEMEKQVAFLQNHPELIDGRLAELDKEWDVERMLETGSSTLTLAGLVLGITRNRKWLLLSLIVQGFFMQHAINGWCPPLPVLRRLGFRTQFEIEQERYALKGLRGDFQALPETSESRGTSPVLEAVRR